MTELSIQQLSEAAMQSHRAGDAAKAEALCNQALSRQPECGDALHLLGLISSERGQQENARDLLERAIEANPLCAEYRTNLGVVLEALGRPDEAAGAYRLALEIRPDLIDAHKNLGIVLGKLRRFDEAIVAWRAASEMRDDDPEIHNSLGAALYASGQFEPALLEFAKAIELRPDFAEAYNNVGNALFSRDDADLAIVAYQKAVAIKPGLIDAQLNLANALDRRGRREEALKAHVQVASARPDHAGAQMSAGDAFTALGLWDAGADSYRRALELNPRDASAAASLGNALLAKMDLDGAVTAYRWALELQPDLVAVVNNLGIVFKEQGLLDESLKCCESAMNLRPNDAAIHSNLVYLMSFHPGYDSVELSRQQRRWNELHAKPLKDLIRPHGNDRSPDRRLKIGYVSPNLCRHVVGQNLFPLLREHDHEQFEIHCYSSVPKPDAFSELLRGHTDIWRDVADRDDEALAEIIRRDRIDTLVDLSLHMARNRLLVFARKPAPVQATFAGYPASTGLDAIDYRITDPYLDAPGSNDQFDSEAPIRLPDSFWCYDPRLAELDVNVLPAQTNGFVTFGCLNNFCKVNEPVLKLWAEVLKAVGRSRLMMLCPEGSHRQRLLDLLQREGVQPDRVELVTHRPHAQYLKQYHRIDLGLDTFPYNGHTTSLDAFWMGVPVVSLVGETAVGRGGKSILSNIGLPELAARRPRQFVQTAITLAQSPDRLAELRRTMRHRMLTSPLMNARRFARNIENVYRQMWTQWCLSRDRAG
jgi:protein O-GlcNAc transferase